MYGISTRQDFVGKHTTRGLFHDTLIALTFKNQTCLFYTSKYSFRIRFGYSEVFRQKADFRAGPVTRYMYGSIQEAALCQ